MSEERNNNRRPRRRRNSQNRNRSKDSSQRQSASSTGSEGQGRPSRNNRGSSRPGQRRNNNPRRSQGRSSQPRTDDSAQSQKKVNPRGLSVSKVVEAYDELMERHRIARKLYFRFFHSRDKNKARKYQSQFYQSLSQLRKFEAELKPWQKEALETQKTEFFPLDTEHSQNTGELAVPAEQIPEAPELSEVHLLLSQKERVSFKDDTEESTGTMDDYTAYKESVSN